MKLSTSLSAAFAIAIAVAGCAHHSQVAKHVPTPRTSSPTRSAQDTGQPRVSDDDPGLTRTTSAEIRSEEPKPASTPEPRAPGEPHHGPDAP